MCYKLFSTLKPCSYRYRCGWWGPWGLSNVAIHCDLGKSHFSLQNYGRHIVRSTLPLSGASVHLPHATSRVPCTCSSPRSALLLALLTFSPHFMYPTLPLYFDMGMSTDF